MYKIEISIGTIQLKTNENYSNSNTRVVLTKYVECFNQLQVMGLICWHYSGRKKQKVHDHIMNSY